MNSRRSFLKLFIAGGYGPPFFFFTRVARVHPTGYVFHITGPSEPGMSGSPVANRNGLVVGVLTQTAEGSSAVTGSWHFQELYQSALQEN